MKAKTASYIYASSHFLTEPLPNNWEEMSEDEISNFLLDNAWEALETSPPDETWNCIESLAEDFIQFADIYGGSIEF